MGHFLWDGPYDSGDDDNLGRISYLADDSGGAVGTHLAEYGRLGLGQIVKVDYTEPDLRLDLLSSGGLDKFDRVVDLRWIDYAPNPDVDAVRIKHTYDRMSNRLSREDVVAASNGQDLDEFYSYDGVNQLKTFQRGNLTGSPPTGVTSKNFAQRWCFDATGNWIDFDQDDDGDNTWDLQQARSHNRANEITALTAGWATPAHDRAGNMTTIPQPNSPSESYTLTFDAWNRLVRVEDGEHLLAECEYDGLNRRTLKRVWPTAGEGPSGADSSSSSSSSSGGDTFETTHFYYSNQWQVLEERVDDSTDADRQYVWGLRYMDDLILRDRDVEAGGDLGITGSGLDERLYALQDANWNVVAIADTAGDVAERYIYAAYGQPTVLNADFTEKAAGTAYAWEYLFTGRRLDEETGLMHYRYRYYHLLIGRFLSRDPIAYFVGVNLYEYVGDSPVTRIDPTGLFWPLFYTDFDEDKERWVSCGYHIFLLTGSWCSESEELSAATDRYDEYMTCSWDCEVTIHKSVCAYMADAGGAGATLAFTHLPYKTSVAKPPFPGTSELTTLQSRLALLLHDKGYKGIGQKLLRRGAQEAGHKLRWTRVRSGVKSGIAGVALVELGFSIYCGLKCST